MEIAHCIRFVAFVHAETCTKREKERKKKSNQASKFMYGDARKASNLYENCCESVKLLTRVLMYMCVGIAHRFAISLHGSLL